MSIQKFNLGIITLLALLLNTNTHAEILRKNITCPLTETIHQVKLVVKKSDGAYLAKSKTNFESNGFLWRAVSTIIIANNKNEAEKIADNLIHNVSDSLYSNARYLWDNEHDYGCFYYDNSLSNPYVAIIAERLHIKS
jgi:hypothetical protein